MISFSPWTEMREQAIRNNFITNPWWTSKHPFVSNLIPFLKKITSTDHCLSGSLFSSYPKNDKCPIILMSKNKFEVNLWMDTRPGVVWMCWAYVSTCSPFCDCPSGFTISSKPKLMLLSKSAGFIKPCSTNEGVIPVDKDHWSGQIELLVGRIYGRENDCVFSIFQSLLKTGWHERAP